MNKPVDFDNYNMLLRERTGFFSKNDEYFMQVMK
jgi:hypothetical protein